MGAEIALGKPRAASQPMRMLGENKEKIMIKFMKAIFILLCFSWSWSAMAEEVKPAPESVAKTIRQAIPDLQIQAVRLTPMQGIYEIQVDRNVYYTDATGKYLIAGGHMFETKTHRDLTRERLEDINRIDWGILPLDKAIVSGDPKAELEVAIFTDPDCPYCQRLEKELKKVQGVKVYTFLYPLTQIHPNARAKSETIWCSDNRHETMLKIMLDGANAGKASCETPLDEIQMLGRRLGINGTPTLIARDGRLFAGFKEAEELKSWLQAGK